MGFKFTVALLTFATAVASGNIAANAQEIYETDQGHTEVIFAWSHAGVSMQHGEFTKVSGTLTLFPDKVEDSSVQVTIDASSLFSGFENLDNVLKSSRWFDVEKYPEITFQSTSVEKTGKHTAKVTGDLTMHGVTKPVVLDTKLTLRGTHPTGKFIPHYKGIWVAFHATTKLDHQAFGIGAYSTGPIYVEINTELKGQ